jgi:tetratricopeptide (TPR) repeat protein
MALKYYHLAEKFTSTDETLYVNLGFAYIQAEDFTKAGKYFQRSIEVNGSPWGYVGKALAYRRLSKNKTFEKDFETAYTEFQNNITNNPLDYLSHFGLAYICSRTERYEEEIEHLNEAISLKPRFGIAYYNRAIALIKLFPVDEVEDEASKNFIEAIVLHPQLLSYAKKDKDLDSFREKKCYKCMIQREFKE